MIGMSELKLDKIELQADLSIGFAKKPRLFCLCLNRVLMFIFCCFIWKAKLNT